MPVLILDCGARPRTPPLQGGAQAMLCAAGSLAALDPAAAPSASTCCRRSRRAGRADRAGRHTTPPRRRRRALLRHARASTPSGSATRPGLVLGRIVCQLINEAASRSARASAAPRTSTPAWCSGSTIRAARSRGRDAIGARPRARRARRARDEYREERYRPAPASCAPRAHHSGEAESTAAAHDVSQPRAAGEPGGRRRRRRSAPPAARRRRPFPRLPRVAARRRERGPIDADRATWIVGARPARAAGGWPAPRGARTASAQPGALRRPARAGARASPRALRARAPARLRPARRAARRAPGAAPRHRPADAAAVPLARRRREPEHAPPPARRAR